MNLWLDDLRKPPVDGDWTWAKNSAEAKILVKTGSIIHASLDHDLGWDDFTYQPYFDKEDTGFDFLKWMVEDAKFWPETLALHSDNAWGRGRMRDLIERDGPYADWYELEYICSNWHKVPAERFHNELIS